MKKTILTLSLSFITLNAIEMPPMPPMIDTKNQKVSTKKANDVTKTNRSTPKSCDMIPPMIIFLPPPMEKEVVTCQNELHKPKKEFVQKQLSKLLKKKIIVNKIEIVKKFNQLYKITYNGGTILTNKTVDAFIQTGSNK